MNTGIIAARYARALFGFAKDMGCEESVYREMKVLARSLMQFPEVKAVLSNPVLSQEKKYGLICAAAGDSVSDQFGRFIRLVLQQKREGFLHSICLLYIDLYRKEHRIQHIDLVSAVPLDSEMQKRITALATEAMKEEVYLDTTVDPNLIGGFVAQWDSYRLDASVAGQLRKIKENLMQQK